MTRHYFLVLPLLLVGAILRFHALDRQSLWDDEMSTLRTIALPLRALPQRLATYETHPPLYFLQLKVWRALRMRSLVKLRANSALWGTLSLFLVYVATRFYAGETAGLFAMAYLALSPFHLAYSQELRSYAMAMTIGLAALLALERRSWVWLGLLWTALLYTHYWGAFVVLAQAIYGYNSSPFAATRKAVVIAGCGACLLFSPCLLLLGPQLGVIDRLVFWASPFSLGNLAKVFLAYSGLAFNMASWTFYLPTTVGVLGLIGLLFAAALGLGLVGPDRSPQATSTGSPFTWKVSGRGPRGPVIWLVVGLGVPWLLSIWKPAIFIWYRFPVLMLPAFAILIAAGLLAVKPAALRLAMAFALLGSQVWGSWIYFHGWQKANPKAVVQYVHWLKAPGALIIRPSYFADLYSFYDQGTTAPVDEDLFDTPDKRAALNGKRVILIAFDVPYDPVTDALVAEFKPLSARYFPGRAHLGIMVYQLK